MSKEELECSFCGRKKPETNLLIAGLDAHICDRCIGQAHGIVTEESNHSSNNELNDELMLKKPKKIKEFLDAYIIGHIYVHLTQLSTSWFPVFYDHKMNILILLSTFFYS